MVSTTAWVTDLGLVVVGTVTKEEGGTESAEKSGSTLANSSQQGQQGKHARPLQPSLAKAALT